MLTEKQIVEAVRNGRREGHDAMVAAYAPRVFAMIVRQVSDTMTAQELTQDTFLKAFRNIDSYSVDGARLSTWLCRIAYRLTLDFLKRRRPLIVSLDGLHIVTQFLLNLPNCLYIKKDCGFLQSC
jgi:RNA polymerase sigma-70 factor (ECF subfamily)